jgi:NAD(P)-dependent dehydrogenase (short-subunit alcohol dehydrogenase family)
MLRENIKTFVKKHHFDLVILNAGMLGDIKELGETSLDEIHGIMDLNVWANKHIIDTLDLHAEVDQLIAISSGAAVNSHKGWGAYAISKAALNTMIKIYAEEKPWTHFSAVSPGVIMTPMLKRIFDIADPVVYPSVQKLREGAIMSPDAAARIFLNFVDKAREHESGSFLDIRKDGMTFPAI